MPIPSSPAARSLPPVDILRKTSKTRLQALYSDFSRQKQSNPTAFHANVEWWRNVLRALVNSGEQQDTSTSTGSRLALRADRSLPERLREQKIGKPLALGVVVNELLSSRSLISMSEFMTSNVSIYDPGWLPYRIASFVVGKPLWWALEQVGIVGEDGLLNSSSSKEANWFGQYIFVELVEHAADAIISLQEEKTTGPADALYTVKSFRRSFGSITGSSDQALTETDANIILKYLERERKVLILDGDVVKFINSFTSPAGRTITSVDRGILELKSAIHSMERLLGVVQGRIDCCTKKATNALQQKQKQVALSHLKLRKQLQGVYNKRLTSLDTLQATMVSIETAVGDIQLMKNFELSTSTLRSILSHSSLDRDNIEKTMDALAEANHTAQEVNNTIRDEGDIALGIEINEEELEGEWKALLRDIEVNEEVTRRLVKLQVPDNLPDTIGAAESATRLPLLSQ